MLEEYSQRITFIIGAITQTLYELHSKMNEHQKRGFEWFKKAVEEVVYKGNPLPSMEAFDND